MPEPKVTITSQQFEKIEQHRVKQNPITIKDIDDGELLDGFIAVTIGHHEITMDPGGVVRSVVNV